MSNAQQENQKPLSRRELLKQKQAEMKKIREEQKALKADLDKNKDERKELREGRAEVRKAAKENKSELLKTLANISKTFGEGSAEACAELADSVMEQASEVAGAIRKFGEIENKLAQM